MIYDFKMLFEPNWGLDTQDLTLDKNQDYKLTPDELEKIEAVNSTLENNDEMKWFIDGESKKELDNIAEQCRKILENDKDMNNEGIPEWEKIKAVLSLLRIHQIKNPWSLWEKVIIISDKRQALLDIVWNNPDAFSGVIPEKWVAMIKSMIQSDNESYIAEIKGENGSLNDDPELARTYLNDIIEDINGLKNNGISASVQEKFKALKGKNSQKFQEAVKILINKCLENVGADKITDLELNENLYSGVIKNFQETIINKSEWPTKQKIRDILNAWGIKNFIDGKLWINTLNAIIEISNINVIDKKERTGVSVAEVVWRKNVENEGTSVDNMPLSLGSLDNLWTINIIRGYPKFEFYGEWEVKPWEPDVVKAIPWHPEQRYVEISNVRYFLSDERPEWALQVKQTPIPHEVETVDWRKIILDNKIQFWKIDEKWNLIEWSEFIIDSKWNQVESTTIDEMKKRQGKKDDSPVEESMMLRFNEWKVKNKKWEKVKFDADWNITFSDENGESTGRFSRRQLDRMSWDDISTFLDKAINAYTETNSKADKPWRYNLNRIVKKIIKDSNLLNNFGGFDDSHFVSQVMLWLESWFKSNPKKKLDSHDWWPDALATRLWIADAKELNEAFSGKDLKEVSESERTKRDRIIHNLTVLKTFVEIKKVGIEKWNTEIKDDVETSGAVKMNDEVSQE